MNRQTLVSIIEQRGVDASSLTAFFDTDTRPAATVRLNSARRAGETSRIRCCRESTRLNRRIDELDALVQPAALARALSEDARERGL